MKAFKAFKPFQTPQTKVKIKIQLDFFSSSGIGTGGVNLFFLGSNHALQCKTNDWFLRETQHWAEMS